jgi:hypothetical protein
MQSSVTTGRLRRKWDYPISDTIFVTVIQGWQWKDVSHVMRKKMKWLRLSPILWCSLQCKFLGDLSLFVRNMQSCQIRLKIKAYFNTYFMKNIDVKVLFIDIFRLK